MKIYELVYDIEVMGYYKNAIGAFSAAYKLISDHNLTVKSDWTANKDEDYAFLVVADGEGAFPIHRDLHIYEHKLK